MPNETELNRLSMDGWESIDRKWTHVTEQEKISSEIKCLYYPDVAHHRKRTPDQYETKKGSAGI